MSRASILARVRAALEAGNEPQPARSRAVAERLATPPQHPQPAFARTEGEERVARLMRCLETQGTTVIEVSDLAKLPSAVEAVLDGFDPKPPLVLGDDERLTALAWSGAVMPRRWTIDQTLGDGTAALTHATAAVAETGTLVMASSAASPASLAFLPEIHLVALARSTIVASFEDAFAELRKAAAPHRLPRAINLISGASRTGDIGGKIVKGAHGPRRLAVILYGSVS